MAVLDAADAGGDRAADRDGGVGVDGDVGAPVFGGFDGGPQLGLGEGRGVERAVGRGDAAAGRELDLRRAEQQLFARAEADFIGAVGDHAAADLFHAGERAAGGAGHFELLAEVAVAAGDGDHRAGGVDARAGGEAFVDRALEAEGGAAEIADGGEAAEERVAGFGGGDDVGVADVVGEGLGGRGPDEHRVPVHVDQAGHEGAAVAVDDFGGGAAVGGNRVGGDLFDLVAADEDVARGRELRRICRRRCGRFRRG